MAPTVHLLHTPVSNLNYRRSGLLTYPLGCLVPAEPDYRYLALSYVWADVKTTKTVQSNLISFLTEGALFREDMDPPLPRTIRDVMRLTELLGERYLCVDALCTVQDIDDDSKASQLNSMASIYNNAVVLISELRAWAGHRARARPIERLARVGPPGLPPGQI